MTLDVRHGDSDSLTRCEECGDTVDVRSTQATALLQNKKTQKFSAVGLHLVRCVYGGHAYYVIDSAKQVVDPFDGDEGQEE